jgi:uncharacterized pyridoxamine 5'-phosphate oxidase family protein
MTKNEIFKLMNENPVFHLATLDGDQPRVRGMLLFRADENGIIFHTGEMKDLYEQIMKNPKAELCFSGNGVQVRVSGVLVKSDDQTLRDEIFSHPSRQFLRIWKENGIDGMLQVFVLKNGTALTWTMDTNFAEKQPVQL